MASNFQCEHQNTLNKIVYFFRLESFKNQNFNHNFTEISTNLKDLKSN